MRTSINTEERDAYYYYSDPQRATSAGSGSAACDAPTVLSLDAAMSLAGVGPYQLLLFLSCALANAMFATSTMLPVLLLPRLSFSPGVESLIEGGFFVASFAGMAITGALSDYVGRLMVLRPLWLAAFCVGLAHFVCSETAAWQFILVRTCAGVLNGGLLVASFVLLIESCSSPRQRTIGTGCFFVFGWACAVLALVAVAFLSEPRRRCR